MAYSKLMLIPSRRARSQPIAAAHVGEADEEEADGDGDEQEVHGSPLPAWNCTTGASHTSQAGASTRPPRLAFCKRVSGCIDASCDSQRRPRSRATAASWPPSPGSSTSAA